METTNRRMLAGLMTEAEIQATSEKWSKVGAENSRERNVAFDLLRLTYHIEQANIPNQIPSYDQANADQFLAHLNAVKGQYRLTNKKIEDGLNWLKELGLLPEDWYIPSIDSLETKSKLALQRRGKASE